MCGKRYEMRNTRKRIICRKIRVHNYKNNQIDQDIKWMLFPLNLMQMITFFPKYSIRSNIIKPNSLILKFVSLTATILFISAFIHRHFTLLSRSNIHSSSLIYTYAATVAFCLGCIINFIYSVIKTRDQIIFVLTIQRIHRFLNNRNVYKHFVIWNWIYVIGLFIFYISAVTYFTIMLNLPIYSTYSSVILICHDVNLICAIRLMRLLQDKAVLWNDKIWFQENENGHHNNVCRRTFKVYVDILKSFNVYRTVFQIPVSKFMLNS
ncbi:hypothetical protein B5X24_HaOG200726 [Helicoverpa armigera]|uniref:Gustatory receptor n=1 Tax=Helicoverpa armigera TaxID=29058 RepID=A0A2W1BWM0_HELAM|nr:hypothetical protein B5X24_HaOG200726 [Helicoverpa armigera]